MESGGQRNLYYQGKALSCEGQTMPHWVMNKKYTEQKRAKKKSGGWRACNCGGIYICWICRSLREVACFVSLFCNDTLWFPSCPTWFMTIGQLGVCRNTFTNCSNKIRSTAFTQCLVNHVHQTQCTKAIFRFFAFALSLSIKLLEYTENHAFMMQLPIAICLLCMLYHRERVYSACQEHYDTTWEYW